RPSPVLEFKRFAEDGSWDAYFSVLEGSKDIDAGGSSFKLYDWMLCRLSTDEGAEPLPEILFDDLQFFNSVFPLAKAKWAAQPPELLRNVAVASPVAVNASDEGYPIVTLQIYRAPDFKISPGQKFRLILRFVDFNLPKILRNFLEIDIESRTGEKSVFLRLLENPNEVGRAPVGDEVNDSREENRLHTL